MPEHYDRLIEGSRLARVQGGYSLLEGVGFPRKAVTALMREIPCFGVLYPTAV